MDVSIITAIIGVACAVIVASITAFYSIASTKKKTQAEIDELKVRAQGEVLSNLRESQTILKEMLGPLENEIKILRAEVDSMRPFVCRNATNCPNRINLN